MGLPCNALLRFVELGGRCSGTPKNLAGEDGSVLAPVPPEALLRQVEKFPKPEAQYMPEAPEALKIRALGCRV